MTDMQQLFYMADNVYITEFLEHHLEPATDVLVRSFLTLNDIWKKYNYTYENIYPIIRAKVIPSLTSRWSFVLIKNQKVIGLVTNYDLLDHLQFPSMPTNLQMFAKLGKAGKQLEKKIDVSQFKRGDACYGPFAVIDPAEASQGYSLRFWWQLFAYGKTAGWKYYYSRISSPVSLNMLLKLNAEIISETEVEGVGEKCWMVRLNLQRPFPTFTMLEAMAARKPKARPSL